MVLWVLVLLFIRRGGGVQGPNLSPEPGYPDWFSSAIPGKRRKLVRYGVLPHAVHFIIH
jgi:hypothetical protein